MIKSSKKSISFSNYLKIVKPEYVYLQLIPNNSIRNYNSDRISKAISTLYINISQRIHIQDKKMFIYHPSKVSYYTYISKNSAEFYFIIPSTRLNLIKDKIGDTWKGITIKQVDSIPTFSKDATKYYLNYKKEDALSLSTDKRTNTLLSSTLNVIDIMEEDDKVGIFYNFMPNSQYTWRSEYEETLEKFKQNIPIDKQKVNAGYIIKMTLVLIFQTVDSVLSSVGDFLGVEQTPVKKSNKLELPIFGFNDSKLSIATKNKKEDIVLDTQIAIISESKSKIRMDNNAMSICQSFKSVSEDNELKHKRLKHDIDFDDYNLKGASTMRISTSESQNFLALPGKELLEDYDFIEKVDTLESQVPLELQKGSMCIGNSTFKGQKVKAYLSNDKEFKNLTVAVIAPTRAGKTTLLQNLCKNAIDNGECVIIPDFIDWCQMSHEISKVVPKSKQLIIDCENLEKLQGFGFNELWLRDAPAMEMYNSAKRQTAQLLTLIDGINDNTKNLSVKMDRYLESSALVVFSCYGSLKDVFDVLRSHKARQHYIDSINPVLKPMLSEYVETLCELNEVNREGVVTGTKISAIVGILDRANKLKRNTAMEIMLKTSCDNNIDLMKEIQKPQVIIIRMPDNTFSTEMEKDFMCTYWLSKIWLTLQLRSSMIKDRNKRVKVNMFWDELSQVEHTQELLKEKLSQIAKFDAKNIITCHYLEQIKIIRNELKAANTSYMLLAGTNKDNYKELKDELYPYELEDLMNLKRYESLNLLKTRDGYAKFITKLPPPII